MLKIIIRILSCLIAVAFMLFVMLAPIFLCCYLASISDSKFWEVFWGLMTIPGAILSAAICTIVFGPISFGDIFEAFGITINNKDS